MTTFDGRETAPAAATPELFLGADGKPLGFFDAVIGGRSVGVPGVPRLLETVHTKYGKLELGGADGPRNQTCRGRLRDLAAAEHDDHRRHRPARHAAGDASLFLRRVRFAAGVGTMLRNPDYAQSLRSIAEGGADAFYKGSLAGKIVAAVNGHPTNPGDLSLEDLAAYQVKERPAVCAPYRGYSVCGMGPPSSGALTIGQILGMVEPFDIATLGRDDPESWRIIGDASRLAFADRERYIADSDFVTHPQGVAERRLPQGALSADPPADRARPRTRSSPASRPGRRPSCATDGKAFDMPATSHFVIVDAEGNVASMTTSVENAFGSRQMAGGFILNNQLTDFSFAPEKDGAAVANRVEPGKRPRSSMAPTIVLKDGKPALCAGLAGRIEHHPYVATAPDRADRLEARHAGGDLDAASC